MRHPPEGRSFRLVGAAVGFVLAIGLGEQTAAATPTTVALLAPAGSRLAEELKRELAISAFAVVVIVPDRPKAADKTSENTADKTADWKDLARDLISAELPRAVAVRADERQVIVLSRSSDAGGVQTSFELQLDPDDRPTRRRACLTVVEYLRVLVEGDERALFNSPSAVPRGQAPDTSVATATAPLAAVRIADTTGANVANPANVASPTNVASPANVANAANVADPGDDEPAAASDEPSLLAHALRAQPWTMGVGTTLDLALKGGQTAGHLQFIWVFPLGRRLSVRALAQWPVLGADFRTGGTDVRMWSFGAAFGLQYSFTEAPALWRPFAGLAVGNRMTLTEASSGDPLQSRSSVTPSANLGLDGGIRYALSPLVQLFSELEIAQDWMVPTANRMDYEKSAANATSFHTSIGVLFEY